MSIFEEENREGVEARYNKINETTPKIIKGEVNRCRDLFETFWGTENDPISREDAVALLEMLGQEAKPAFEFHGAWQQLLAMVIPNYEPLVPPYELEVNEDGTVSLKEDEIPTA